MAEVSSVFKEIEEALQSDGSLAKGVEAVYQFQLDGDESNVYQLNLQGENSVTSEGAKDDADCTLKMSSDDFVKMTEGELNGTQAFMSGKLKIKGNMGLALKLQDILQSYNKQKS
ncbi:MAG TPA: SCP2 sterol-binding domain-containing protein [Pseudogracilibacillus sp.]|nr:SCP2 sterol-binding domain-containing protein [Pseudogracilibacillus sp.]